MTQKIHRILIDRITAWWHIRSNTFRSLVIATVILVGGLITVNIAFFAGSFFPRSCNICHIMKPYYENWKTSSHQDTTCIKCHPYRFGFISTAILKYFTGTYNPKPHAIVNDNSCMKQGCHSGYLDNGKVAFKGSISFDHKSHIEKTKRGEQLRCASCHSQIVQGNHLSVTEKVCFLCHFKGAEKGQSVTGCPSCHGTPTKIVEHEGFSFSHESYLRIGVPCNQCHTEVASGNGSVPKEKCHSCHVEKDKNSLTFQELHKVHVTKREIYCFDCHTEINHGSIRLTQPFEVQCKSCHELKHSPQKELYMGVSGKGVADTPSRMFAAQVSCDGCHTHSATKKTTEQSRLTGVRKTCVNCHGKGYDLMLDDWVREINSSLNFVYPYIKEAELLKGRINLKNKKHEGTKGLFEDAIFNYNLVKNGKGVHNVEYSVKLLSSALDQVEIAKKALKQSTAHISRPEILRGQDSYCSRLCHTRIGLPEKKVFEDMHIEFPHKLHAENMGLGCATCHSPEKHKMRIITKEGCMNCHHSGKNLNCAQCHPFQVSLYRGNLAHKKIKPDPMFSGGVYCDGCHNLQEKTHTAETIKGKCTECHDKNYEKILIQWEKELLNAETMLILNISKLNELIDRKKLLGQDLPDKIIQLLKNANLILKATGEGKGIHNYNESLRLLKETNEEIEKHFKIPG